MKILALDIATKMGCAIGHVQGKPHSWAVDFGKGLDHDERFAKALQFVQAVHREFKPDLVAVEAAIGGSDANAYLIGMVACIRGQAKALGVPTVAYHSGSIRKHFLGKALTSRDFPGMSQAKAKLEIKQKVLVRCRALGWTVGGLDEADAMATWDYACAQESKAHQMQTLGGMFEGKSK